MKDEAMQREKRRVEQAADEKWARENEKPVWGDIYWKWKMRGYPPEEAAYRADEHLRKHARAITTFPL